MESYSVTKIIRILTDKSISLFSLTDFARLFKIRSDNTLYKKIQRLEKAKIIKRLIKGKYLFLLSSPSDFQIANYLYQPSYISLESALSFYGVVTGFPYKIISITSKKPKSITAMEKEYQYCRIAQDLFWGFEKKENFLIAQKEKALLDYLYFGSKGLRTIDWTEFETKDLDKEKLLTYAKRFHENKLLEIMRKEIR